MTTFPAPAYLSDALRTQSEVKDALEDFLAATVQLPGAGGAVSTLTIASGSITPAAGVHLVDTEAAAASDDLATVLQTNLPDGSLLCLRSASVARTVVVKHAAGGAGQVAIADAADLSLLDPSQWLLLRRNGSQWDEVGRHYGNQKAALRSRYDLAALTAGPNTFTKTQEWAKGADLTAAATLALGTDGNYFVVTGNTGITAIAAKSIGTRLLLQFSGTPTLTHHASNLILQNATSLSVAAGDLLELISIGSGQWREINRHLAVEPPGFQGSPETHLEAIWEEFLGAITGGVTYTPPAFAPGSVWVTSATSGVSIVAGYRGIIRVVGDGAGTAYGFQGGQPVAAGDNPTLYMRFAQRNATASTRRIGWGDRGGAVIFNAEPTHGIYVRYAAGGNLIAVCRATNVESTLDTGVPAADGVFHTVRFAVTGTTAVAVYVDGVLKGTLVANIPSASLLGGWGVSTNDSTAGHDVDYMVQTRAR